MLRSVFTLKTHVNIVTHTHTHMASQRLCLSHTRSLGDMVGRMRGQEGEEMRGR